MTGRRPQDPRTRPIRDDDANIPTLGPDPGATVAPDEQRDIETVDPSATVLPTGFAAPKPRSSLIESKAARAISEGALVAVQAGPEPTSVPLEPERIHRVASGDSLWTISKRYRVRMADLMRWNDLSKGSVLRIGQTLKVQGNS